MARKRPSTEHPLTAESGATIEMEQINNWLAETQRRLRNVAALDGQTMATEAEVKAALKDALEGDQEPDDKPEPDDKLAE